MQPKVSVVIPVYNAAEHLEQCLRSIIEQTLKEIEIICVDDGSTDSSYEILTEQAAVDKRFIVLQQKNRYAGAARNAGLDVARGGYVVFLDADDFFAPDFLEKMYERAVRDNADIVICGGQTYNSANGEYKKAGHYLNIPLIGNRRVFSRRNVRNDIMTVTNPAPWNKLFRRSFLLREKLRFQPLQNSNDVYMVLLALCAAERIGWVDEALVNYRICGGKSLQDRKSRAPLCFIQALEALYDELRRRNIWDEVKKSFVTFAISTTAYNLRTLPDGEEKHILFSELQKPHFTRMGILDYPNDYYVNRKDFNLVKGMQYAFAVHESCRQKRECVSEVRKAGSVGDPKVTVVIPVYNVERYIDECLDSIIGQTLKEIEIICVNDGSTDGSLEHLDRYADADGRITVLTQRNAGISAARNAGFRRAHGEFVYYMDSDDVLELEALESLYSKAKDQNLDILYFNLQAFADEGMDSRLLDKYNAYYQRTHEYNGTYTGTELMKQMKKNGEYLASPCAQFARKDFLQRKGIKFYEGIVQEDELYTFCITLAAQRAGYLDRALYLRRLREGSTMTAALSFKNVYGYFVSYIEMQKYCERKGMMEDENELVLSAMAQMLRAARDRYFQLSEAEQYAYWGLPVQTQRLFEKLMARPAPLSRSEKTKSLLKRGLQKILQKMPQRVLQKMRQKIPQKLLQKLRQWKES